LVRNTWLKIGSDWAKLAGAQAKTAPVIHHTRAFDPCNFNHLSVGTRLA
jgi:hypothetical protein